MASLLNVALLSQSHEGGFGQACGLEAHGGATYCAVSLLSLTEHLTDLTGHERLKQWCVQRQQTGGFAGRTNKRPDSSYSFWVGATLQVGWSFSTITAELTNTN